MTTTRTFISGAPATTPRPDFYHEYVRRLLADGWRFDMTAAEWVSPDGRQMGRVSWTEDHISLRTPTTSSGPTFIREEYAGDLT